MTSRTTSPHIGHTTETQPATTRLNGWRLVHTKEWYGHHTGWSRCARSMGKFFGFCFSPDISAPSSPGNYLYFKLYLGLSQHFPINPLFVNKAAYYISQRFVRKEKDPAYWAGSSLAAQAWCLKVRATCRCSRQKQPAQWSSAWHCFDQHGWHEGTSQLYKNRFQFPVCLEDMENQKTGCNASRFVYPFFSGDLGLDSYVWERPPWASAAFQKLSFFHSDFWFLNDSVPIWKWHR